MRQCAGHFCSASITQMESFWKRAERSFCLKKLYLEFTLLETSLIYQAGVSCSNLSIQHCIVCMEQGIALYIQKLFSHLSLEILRDREGSKSIASEVLFYFRYDFTNTETQLYQLLSYLVPVAGDWGGPATVSAATGYRFPFSPLYQQHFSNPRVTKFKQLMWQKLFPCLLCFLLT